MSDGKKIQTVTRRTKDGAMPAVGVGERIALAPYFFVPTIKQQGFEVSDLFLVAFCC